MLWFYIEPQQADPELAQVILGNDLNKLQDLLRQRHRQRSELRRQQEEEFVST
jgi:DNA damage-inducible protein 1